jgi:hypothetical protein
MKHSTQPYQYKSDDGKKFISKADKEMHQEQLMEKRALQQEEKYRDDQDRVPNWLWPDEDHMC